MPASQAASQSVSHTAGQDDGWQLRHTAHDGGASGLRALAWTGCRCGLEQSSVRWCACGCSAQASLTLVMPYMVVGRMMVSSGVLWRGVLEPNTAMVLGAYTARSCAAASSSTFWIPCVLTCASNSTITGRESLPWPEHPWQQHTCVAGMPAGSVWQRLAAQAPAVLGCRFHLERQCWVALADGCTQHTPQRSRCTRAQCETPALMRQELSVCTC